MTAATDILVADVTALEAPEVFSKYFECVSASRQAKVLRMRFNRDRCLSLGAGVLASQILLSAGVDGSAEMLYDENGRPFFPDYPDLHISLSHSGTKVMAVLSRMEVGCDTERIAEPNLRISERFFASGENLYVSSGEIESDKALRFYRMWTLKESFLKCTGLGMKFPMDEFEIVIDVNGISVIQNRFEGDFYFREFSVGDGYAYSLCGRDPGIPEIPEQRMFFFE